MDNIDKQLISILQKDGRTSLSKLGKDLEMSHVAVSKRLDKLIKEDAVHICAGVNAEALNIKILFIGLETENAEVTDRLLEQYKNCPRLTMLAPVTGRYNLFAVMVAEDTFSLESILGTCSIRTQPGIRKSEAWFGNSPSLPEFVHLDLSPAKKKNDKEAACGFTCVTCKRYELGRCVGCPSTSSYRGVLWESPLTKGRKKAKSKS
ncbi:MAG: Lrp/AsnC family transcriptional regulator [Candidatus Thorarchaeota archaeon]